MLTLLTEDGNCMGFINCKPAKAFTSFIDFDHLTVASVRRSKLIICILTISPRESGSPIYLIFTPFCEISWVFAPNGVELYLPALNI